MRTGQVGREQADRRKLLRLRLTPYGSRESRVRRFGLWSLLLLVLVFVFGPVATSRAGERAVADRAQVEHTPPEPAKAGTPTPLAALADDRLVVATYNVQNYTAADRRADGIWQKGYPKPEVEKTALRAVIRELGADVLLLQEIGGPPYVAELVRDLAREGCAYPTAEVLLAADPERGVAVLSRRPLTLVRRHLDLRTRASGASEPVKRGLLEVRLPFAGRELTLWGVHLKSQVTELTDDPQGARQRGEEAEAVRDRILTTFPEPGRDWFMLAGDCNDGRNSRALRALQTRGRTTILQLLPAADSRGEVWTHFYTRDEVYLRLDYLMWSPGLAGAAGVSATARIVDTPEVARASDHRPVVVTLTAQAGLTAQARQPAQAETEARRVPVEQTKQATQTERTDAPAAHPDAAARK